ncbi:MAG: hypothetical protein OEY51_12480 [Cyclobacteriaceae bacterium]|nr:hypothetical protein [Cyclobacteriaceae bacterium]
MLKEELSQNELNSIKTSYFNILALFLGRDSINSKYVGCLIKWAIQLRFSSEELHYTEENFRKLDFEMPSTSTDKLEAIFHLVHMIYLDNVVEDIELEVASLYAEHLGFEKYVVGEIFQSIATAPYDGKTLNQVQGEIREILKFHNY